MTILRGIKKSNDSSVGPFLGVLKEFLAIDDSLKEQRLEWIFGFPQPKKFHEGNYYKHYGSYGISSLKEAVISYKSTLQIYPVSSFTDQILNQVDRY